MLILKNLSTENVQNSESYLQITPEVITDRFYKIRAENMTYSGNILIKSWTENFKFRAVLSRGWLPSDQSSVWFSF